jgi:hypothetical protein
VRVATLLKQVSANASQSATEDQASDHSHQTKATRPEFELQITEDTPTRDQVYNILEYLGPNKIGSVIPGTSTLDQAMKKFKESTDNFKRPVVSWACCQTPPQPVSCG